MQGGVTAERSNQPNFVESPSLMAISYIIFIRFLGNKKRFDISPEAVVLSVSITRAAEADEGETIDFKSFSRLFSDSFCNTNAKLFLQKITTPMIICLLRFSGRAYIYTDTITYVCVLRAYVYKPINGNLHWCYGGGGGGGRYLSSTCDVCSPIAARELYVPEPVKKYELNGL